MDLCDDNEEERVRIGWKDQIDSEIGESFVEEGLNIMEEQIKPNIAYLRCLLENLKIIIIIMSINVSVSLFSSFCTF